MRRSVPAEPMRIVILGLSITSSWGNGHATTYRALVKALVGRGHDVLFLERDVPWYAENRDLPQPPYGSTRLYADPDELRDTWAGAIRSADVVVVGSYVPDGVTVGEWVVESARGVTAFYDIDTPITLSALESGGASYLSAELVGRYRLYLSFTGGPTLRRIERRWGAARARALYCGVDPAVYHPQPDGPPRWDLGYMGTYSEDRQGPLERLLLEAAHGWPEGRFVVAGPQYPPEMEWPHNVERVEHLSPREHRAWYNAQRFTLNVTRRDMVRAGWSPSVRLFEAAACGTPIVTDVWPGLEEFFTPGAEVLVSRSARETLAHVRGLPEPRRREIGERARDRVLREHTAERRAEQLEGFVREAAAARRG